MIHVLKKRFTNSELGDVGLDQKRELNQAQLEPQLASKVVQHGSLSETLKEKLLQTELLAVGPETELHEVAEQLTLLKAVNGLGVGHSDLTKGLLSKICKSGISCSPKNKNIPKGPSIATRPRKRKRIAPCARKGCPRNAKVGFDLCCHHVGRGKLTCRFSGCSKFARSGYQFCSGHGGKNLCRFPGCKKGAKETATNLCFAHGGGKRCQREG